MELLELSEVKRIQLNMLVYVAQFCINNKINYWIDCGTLLGAIRHEGYIPWDDDVDIGMLRKDYDKFLDIFNNDNESFYRVVSLSNDKTCCVPFAKIYDTSTILYEPDESGYKQCIFIDVLVYDNVPNNLNIINSMYKKRDYLQKIYNIKTLPVDNDSSFFWKITYNILKVIFCLIPINPLILIQKNSKKYESVETGYVGNFLGYKKIVCKKEILEEFIDVKFENYTFKAPKDYDYWLKIFYGKDYMNPPPLDKRISPHAFKAYIK